MDTPKSNKLDIIVPAFRGHSQNFLMVLDGISEEDALKRIEGRTNHIIWMIGNFLDMRFAMGKVLGVEEEFEFKEYFSQGKALDEGFNYPTLDQLKKSFHQISPLVYNKLLEVTDADLDQDFPMGMNIEFFTETVLNFVGMCIGREDYLCGQIGLMRRILGYEGMKYEFDENIKY
ncbi:DinB family protein [Chryseobacterium wangxinyae]|uniref:DinB family protein n=1 Tax=Chryseobacterium sp. CY350 TaxID=2997336 RepID=UPI00226D6A3A|nr:DinB family protein [Chryseobacterium sp. CY350]MCY0976536.1 DinB family protein [Chryseobacterium sp. CY350]WBZ96539.1 DinB family protein [Chryseobacterium sp. CY350]